MMSENVRRTMMLRKSILFMLIMLLNSCASYGGGTFGTGLPLGSRVSKQAKTGISYINFTGIILNVSGLPARNAVITITTPQNEETVRTDDGGRFNVQIVSKVGEKIDVKIIDGNSTYIGSFAATRENLTTGSATFRIVKSGIVISNPLWSE